jgi:hypothetical protein
MDIENKAQILLLVAWVNQNMQKLTVKSPEGSLSTNRLRLMSQNASIFINSCVNIYSNYITLHCPFLSVNVTTFLFHLFTQATG